MRRIAGTAPLIQALLVIVLMAALQYLAQTLGALQFWQKYYDTPSKINEDFSSFNKDYVQLFAENKISSGAPTEIWSFLIFLVIAILGAFFFTLGMQLVARLFYKNSIIFNFNPILSDCRVCQGWLPRYAALSACHDVDPGSSHYRQYFEPYPVGLAVNFVSPGSTGQHRPELESGSSDRPNSGLVLPLYPASADWYFFTDLGRRG